ncbi:MAG: protein-disulfide reductase DsbD domain-containing protein [Pseudomonadota bacterium]
MFSINQTLTSILCSIFFGLLFTSQLIAAQTEQPPNVTAKLISGHLQVRPGDNFYVYLQHDIREGWHTYWRNPGDSGAPTKLRWTSDGELDIGEIAWPIPKRIPYESLMNFGYYEQVFFQIPVSVPAGQAPGSVTLQAKGTWLVCSDICIPENGEVQTEVLVGGESISNPAAAHAQAYVSQRLPRNMSFDVGATVTEGQLRLDVPLPLDKERVRSVSYFPLNEGLIDNPAAQTLSHSAEGFALEMPVGYNYELYLEDPTAYHGVVVVEEDAGDLLLTGFNLSPVNEAAPTPGSSMSVLTAMLFAFLGGLILNLMPCVFPVLSIKVMALVQHPESVRGHGWAYLGGVVASFVLIAALLMFLRSTGEQIGWGFQLQSPLVIALLSYLFLAVALNLSGFFEFGTRLMSMGDSFAERGGYSGSFFTGTLATLVAAPCTAPFMGAAIGYALTQPAWLSLLVFGSLGLGMASPFLLLCYSPALMARMPRPGPWMVTLKELLAFPMYGAVVWLVWVLSQQTGADGVLLAGVGFVAIAFGLWLLKQAGQGTGALIVRGLAILLFVAALVLPSQMVSQPNLAAEASSHVEMAGPTWESYSAAVLAEKRRNGPVFVNFTAAWCITCKVNEAVALNRTAVKQAFLDKGVGYLKGDWTKEDPEITRKLEEFGRSGVPLYLLYSGPSRTPKVLPQLLTEEMVLAAVQALP